MLNADVHLPEMFDIPELILNGKHIAAVLAGPCQEVSGLLRRESQAVSKGRNVRGEKTKNAKLTEKQAREIKDSKEHKSVLATRYGVTENSISNVISGKTWRHIHEQG